MKPGGLASLLGTLAAIVVGGTVFFRVVEGWSWLDAYFFTVVTLSTVGYGSLVPATALGKIGTTVMIFLGLGVFVVAVQQFGRVVIEKRRTHTEWLVDHWRHRNGDRNGDGPEG
jgi:voltage-gated potassium channel